MYVCMYVCTYILKMYVLHNLLLTCDDKILNNTMKLNTISESKNLHYLIFSLLLLAIMIIACVNYCCFRRNENQ